MASSEAEDHDKVRLPSEVGSRRAALGQNSGLEPSDASAALEPGRSPESGLRLAQIKEAILDDAELRALFADIATYGRVEEVTMKAAPRARSEVVRRLPELYLKLVERRLYGAQIRYEFDGGYWLDTLVTTPNGCRLVRVRLPD